jgi:hypothetical protein
MATATSAREQAIMMTSSAALELVWSTIATGAAAIGVSGTAPLATSAAAAIAMSFALLAQSGMMATRWPNASVADVDAPAPHAVGMNVSGALLVLVMGSLALVGVWPAALAPLALFVVAGFLVLDAPIERAFIAPRGAVAAGLMALAGIAAIVTLAAGFSTRPVDHSHVPQAALCIAAAQVIGSLAVLLRSVRGVTR